MNRIVRLSAFAVLCLMLFSAAGGIYIAWVQAYLFVRFPEPLRSTYLETPADYGLEYEDIELRTEDGLTLSGWYLPTRTGASLIAVHGYKAQRSEMLPIVAPLAEAGYGVVMFDLRAHGFSESHDDLISFGYYEMQDMEAAYDFLLAQPGIDPARVGIIGNSMGGSIVIMYAAENPTIRATVAQSPFASINDTIEVSVEHFTGLPAFPFAHLIMAFAEIQTGLDRDAISAIERIDEISPRAVFIMMGGEDTIVSPDNGALLAEAAGEPVEFWYEPDVGHVEFRVQYKEEFDRRVAAFFGEYLD